MNNFYQKYYTILGLPINATDEEVKKRYKKLAKKFHPDVSKEPNSYEKFLEISEAYEIIIEKKITQTYQEEKINEAIKKAKEKADRLAKMKYNAFINRQKREKELSKSYSQGVSFFIVLIVVGLGIYLGSGWYTDYMISQNPISSAGTIVDINEHRITIEFQANGEVVREKKWVTRMPLVYISDNGIPLQKGQVYEVVFLGENPKYFKVNYDKPDIFTLKSHLFRVSELMVDILPEKFRGKPEILAKIQSNCVVNKTYERFGIEGVSHLLHYDQSFLENTTWNSMEFENLIESPEFVSIINECM